MEWLLFALLCPAFWGLNNVFNKFLMTKKFRSYYSMLAFLGLIDAVFIAAAALISPIQLVFPYSFFSMAIGVLPPIAFWFYCRALMMEEISRITPLFQFIPIFVAVLSAVFLNEILSLQRYLGVAVIIVASLLISYRKTKTGGSISSTFKYMIPFSVILAVHAILEKLLLAHIDYWTLFIWNVTGALCGILFMLTLPKPRKEVFETIPHLGKRTFLVGFVGESVYFMGTISWLIAISTGYVSLVSAIAGIQHFFVFAYMLFLSLFVPKVLEEDTTLSVVLLKLAAIALMIVGTWLIAQ